MNTSGDSREFEGDAGAPLPDFSAARDIQLTTVAPALGVPTSRQPEYLDYDQKGRGVIVTMFANAGACYLMGIAGGGLYGAGKGVKETPSPKFKVKLNSVLNQSGRYGSLYGNMFGSAAVLYSLYQGVCDHFEVEEKTGLEIATPFISASLTGATLYSRKGYRAMLGGAAVGGGAVAASFAIYQVVGIPYGSLGLLFL
jgi:import inner membrane translocase subunit TIM23